MRQRLLAPALVCAIVIGSTLETVALPALARESALARLKYSRAPLAESCPDEAGLRSAVATRLGYDPFASEAKAVVTVSVTRAGGFESSIRFEDEYGKPSGEKKLRSSVDDCTELASAMALTISILLDPRAALARPESAPAAPPPSATAPTLSEPDDSPFKAPFKAEAPNSSASKGAPAALSTTTKTEPASPWLLRGGVEAIGSVGAAPSPAIGIGGFVGLGRGALSLDFEARADFPGSLMRDDGTGVRSSLILGTFAPCGHVAVLAFCVLASAGALRGEGLNVGTPERDASFYAAVGARTGIEASFYRGVFLRAHADALFPLTQTTLQNRGVAYWTSPPVAGALGLGVGGKF